MAKVRNSDLKISVGVAVITVKIVQSCNKQIGSPTRDDHKVRTDLKIFRNIRGKAVKISVPSYETGTRLNCARHSKLKA